MKKESEENKKLKEDYDEESDKIRTEIEKSKDFQEFMVLRDIFILGGEKAKANFLLFKTNKSLERIADSLDAIFVIMKG